MLSPAFLSQLRKLLPDHCVLHAREDLVPFESDGLLLVLAVGTRTAIVRLRDDLTVDRWVELEGTMLDPSIIETEDGLILAGWRRADSTYVGELFAAELDRATLEQRSEWRQISATDQLSGAEPALWFGGGHLVASWAEGLGDLRTRCVSWDVQ